jgi:hypothetical protein
MVRGTLETKHVCVCSPILSHAGDGNYHVIILFDPEDPKEVAEAHKLAEDMVHRAIAADGELAYTVSLPRCLGFLLPKVFNVNSSAQQLWCPNELSFRQMWTQLLV